MNDVAPSTAAVLLAVYLFGVVVALFTIDARGLARVGLALLWPLGPIAFVVTISILLLSLPIAFPVAGTLVLAALVGIAALAVHLIG
jgi:hypothetical protein